MNVFSLMINVVHKAVMDVKLSDPRWSVRHYRKKGCTIGDETLIYNTSIDTIRPYLVTVGSNCVITGSMILTHDASLGTFSSYTKIGKVTIGDNVFIGVQSIVLPGITIGSNVIVGAGTVVSKDIPDNCVVAGNPMRVICTTDEFIERNKNRCDQGTVFNKTDFTEPKKRMESIELLSKLKMGYFDNSRQ